MVGPLGKLQLPFIFPLFFCLNDWKIRKTFSFFLIVNGDLLTTLGESNIWKEKDYNNPCMKKWISGRITRD